MFPRDWNAEEFEAKESNMIMWYREPRGTEVDDE